MKTETAQRIVVNPTIVQRKTDLLFTTYELTPLGEILNRITFGRYRRAIKTIEDENFSRLVKAYRNSQLTELLRSPIGLASKINTFRNSLSRHRSPTPEKKQEEKPKEEPVIPQPKPSSQVSSNPDRSIPSATRAPIPPPHPSMLPIEEQLRRGFRPFIPHNPNNPNPQPGSIRIWDPNNPNPQPGAVRVWDPNNPNPQPGAVRVWNPNGGPIQPGAIHPPTQFTGR
jgi:hypothetical protein